MTQEEALPPAQLMESRRIAAGMLNFSGRHPDVVAPLFDLLSIFTVGSKCRQTVTVLLTAHSSVKFSANHTSQCPDLMQS